MYLISNSKPETEFSGQVSIIIISSDVYPKVTQQQSHTIQLYIAKPTLVAYIYS